MQRQVIDRQRVLERFDTLLATRTPTVGRNDVYTTRQDITLSSGLTRGSTYYLGVIVDYDNAISEAKCGS